MASGGGQKVKVGVLALQGSFREHCTLLTRAGAEAVEVRKAEHLNGKAAVQVEHNSLTPCQMKALGFKLSTP